MTYLCRKCGYRNTGDSGAKADCYFCGMALSQQMPLADEPFESRFVRYHCPLCDAEVMSERGDEAKCFTCQLNLRDHKAVTAATTLRRKQSRDRQRRRRPFLVWWNDWFGTSEDRWAAVGVCLGVFLVILFIYAYATKDPDTPPQQTPPRQLTEYEKNVGATREVLKMQNPKAPPEDIDRAAHTVAGEWERVKKR